MQSFLRLLLLLEGFGELVGQLKECSADMGVLLKEDRMGLRNWVEIR